MNVVFVHGWSTTNTDTYGYLPEWLAKQQGFKVSNICLGKYISFVDTVTLDDIARAMDAALREELGDQPKPFAPVSPHSPAFLAPPQPRPVQAPLRPPPFARRFAPPFAATFKQPPTGAALRAATLAPRR